MAHKIPVNLTERDRLDMLSGKPVQNVKFLTLEPAKVETEFVYRPNSTRRTVRNENYADEYRKREFEEFRNGVCGIKKRSTDLHSVSLQSTKLEELESFSDCHDSKSEIEVDRQDAYEDQSEAPELYSRYKFRTSFDSKLSITGYKDQILDMIERNQVSIIQGGTGCGKSTQVCQFILSDAALRGRRCNMVVTQPRKIAAISIARRVCSENSWSLGTICGYQVGLDNKMSSDTRILFCTIGVLLQRLITSKKMDAFTHIILDEVHDRGQDTDFCLLVVRKLMRMTLSNVKVILMSATPDLPLYCGYFKYRNSLGEIVEPSVIRMVGDTYDIKELYLEDLYAGGQLPERDDDPKVDRELMKMAVKIVLSFDDIEKKKDSHIRGSVLIFLPGFEEIEDMRQMLEPYANEHRLELRRLHSAIPTEEQIKVFITMRDNRRKVILATNIAESSITVADIAYVIDFCLTKSMIFNPTTNYSCLRLQWASKSSCAQRKGRAGRVADGTVYRMMEYTAFQKLKDFDTPEMLTSPLDHLVLKSKLFDMGSPKEVLALALTPPDLRNIEKTILLLKEMGAMSPLSLSLHDGELTTMGRVMASLPVDTRLGKLIMLGHAVGLLEEAIVIAALHSVPSIFVQPSHLRLEAYQNKLKWSGCTKSDTLACYFAYKAWEHLKSLEKFSSSGEELHWCRQHFLELKRLREVKVLWEELKRRLNMEFNISVPKNHVPLDLQNEENQLLMKILLCGAFYPNYLISSSFDVTLASKSMCGHDPLRTVMVGGLPDGGGPFYKNGLKRLFERCDPSRGTQKIHFEHTRAYIEFQSEDAMTAVCTALKMRSFRVPLEVDYNESDSMLEGEVGADVTGGPRHVLYPANDLRRITIRVTDTVTCGHFWGSYSDGEYVVRSAQMHRSMQEWVKSNRNALLKEFKVGALCLAPFTDEDCVTLYYRARIVDIRADSVKVFYLDYGNQSSINKIYLYKLDPAFLCSPFQALEFKLAGIRPSPLQNFNGRWSSGARQFFESIINLHGSFCCEVFSVVDDVIRVRMSPSDKPDDDIGEKLVAMGFAEHCEENHVSKENSMKRCQKPKESMNPIFIYDEQQMTDPLSDRSKVSQSQNLDEIVRSQILYKARQVKRMNLLKKVVLSGPTNSFCVSFSSLLSFPGLTWIERCSVNTFVILDDTSGSVPSMMVSCFLVVSPSMTPSLVVRESTILPRIRGLLPIVTLLFAPTAEYRTNKDRTRYTGAVCGLGFYRDSIDSEAVFPENDIELTFDMTLPFEDIKRINDIRVSLNLMMSMKMTGSNLLNIQAAMVKKIFGLICKKRDPLEISHFPYPKLWNKVPEQHLVRTLDGVGNFFMPHSAPALRSDSPVPVRFVGGEPLSADLRKAHHDTLIKYTNEHDLDQVFHCLICNETVVGTPKLSTHLFLVRHQMLLRDGSV